MTKIHWLLLLLTAMCKGAVAQTIPLTPAEKAAIDSMFAEDEFFKMMAEKDRSYFDLSIGIGNGLFSTHNQAENATGVANKLIFTPSVAYNHKSGFGIAVTPFLSADSNRLSVYQVGISPSYSYYGKKIKAGIAYTGYLSDRKKYNTNSLYQHDLYGYIKKVNGIIRPGLSLGYSNGVNKQIDDVQFPNAIRKDTTNNKASYFSVSASAAHEHSFFKLLHAADELDITASLHLNAGSDKTITTHLNKIFNRPVLSKKKRVETNNGFQLQSIAASIQFVYGIKKFYLQPDVYVDYYLPSTSSKRLSSFFSVTAGVTF